jgi:hypothetical protein
VPGLFRKFLRLSFVCKLNASKQSANGQPEI